MIRNIWSFLQNYFIKINILILITIFIILGSILSKYDVFSIYPEEYIFLEEHNHQLIKYDANKKENINKNSNKIFLKFKFEKKDNTKIQNIFQTDDHNFGIRLEIINNNLSLVVSNTADTDDGYKIFLFNTKIYKNKNYEFKIHALKNSGFHAQLNDELIKYYSYDTNFNLSNFILGNGFDGKRPFSGNIYEIYYDTRPSYKKNFSLVLFIKKYFSEIVFLSGLILSYLLPLWLYTRKKKLHTAIKTFDKMFERNKNVVLVISFLITLLIFISIPIFTYFISIYIALFIIGIGFYTTLLPQYIKDDNYSLFFIPIFGLLGTVIIGGYMIAFSFNINYLIYLLPIYSIFLLFFKSNTRSSYCNILINIKTKIYENSYIYLFASIFVIFFLLLPNFIYPDSSFYRIGPDLSLYAKMSQYLADGGLLSEAQERANEFIDMPVGEINRYGDASATWPFMYYFRWGFAAFQNMILSITSATHIHQISFLSLVFSHLFLGFIVFYWLLKVFKISKFISSLAGLAIIFNANLLNLWYEGFYANAFSIFIYLFLLYLISTKKSTKISSNKYELVPIYTFLFIAIFFTYPEGFIFIFAPLIFAIIFFEIIFFRKIEFFKYSLLFISFVIAFILLLPANFLIDWIGLTIKQLSEEGGNGFMQPYWALPHEILGMFNIYIDISGSNAGVKLQRSYVNYILSISVSISILAVIFYYIKNSYKKIDPILYSVYILTGIIGILVFVFSRSNNYLYMKYYVFLSPLLLITFWLALNFCIRKKNYFLGIKKDHIFTIISFLIIFNGLTYIGKYTYQSKRVSQNKIELYENTKHMDFNNTIIYPISYDDILYSYASLIDAPWIINGKFSKKYFQKYMGYKVYIFIKTKDYKENSEYDKIIYKDSEYIIINSGLKLIEIIEKDKDAINKEIFSKVNK